MKLTKEEKEVLNAHIDTYMNTLNKINQVLHNDENTFDRRAYLTRKLAVAIDNVWDDYVTYTTGH